VLTREQAEAVASRFLSQLDPYWPQRDLVITRIEERAISWVVFYSSKRYIDTGDVRDAIAGNGPLVIGKKDGRIVMAGTATPLEQQIVEAEAALDNE